MKIVHALGWYFPDSLGGTEVYVEGLCRCLRAKGHEVFVAAPDDAPSAEERTYDHDGVLVYRYPVPPFSIDTPHWQHQPVVVSGRFHSWLRSIRPDILHAHSLVTGMGLTELEAGRHLGAKVIFTHHLPSLGFVCARGSLMRWGMQRCDGKPSERVCAACSLHHLGWSRFLAEVISLIPSSVSRWALRRCRTFGAAAVPAMIHQYRSRRCAFYEVIDRMVVVNNWAKSLFLACGVPEEKIVTNRLGNPHLLGRHKSPPVECPTRMPITIGFIGRIYAEKGVIDLVRAVRSLPATAPVKIEIRGPTNTKRSRSTLDEVKRLVETDSRFMFAPALAPADIPPALMGYDVLCCPSATLENGPMVALEAHAVGTPVIGTRCGGLEEIVRDRYNGRLVEPGDWRQLASVIQAMIDSPAKTLDRWRTNLSEIRTISEIAIDYERLYETLRC